MWIKRMTREELLAMYPDMGIESRRKRRRRKLPLVVRARAAILAAQQRSRG